MNLKKMSSYSKKIFILLFIMLFFTGCSYQENIKNEKTFEQQSVKNEIKALDYEVIPETFSLRFKKDGISIPVSLPNEEQKVENFIEDESGIKWNYPDEQISISVMPQNDYLNVTITSNKEKDNIYKWPNISGDMYYIPFGEGKRIPQNDKVWNEYLNGKTFSVIEQLSMPFWATSNEKYAVLFILENPYHSNLTFSKSEKIEFSFIHEYLEIDSQKENSFRIYLVENNPVSIAKTYQNYIIEQGKFVTLEQKSQKNPNIKKLYGAPHIYLWGERLLLPEDINWVAFRKSLDSNILKHIIKLSNQLEESTEINNVFDKVSQQDYIDDYQKNVICKFLSEVIQQPNFYAPNVFNENNEIMKNLLEKGLNNLNDLELIQFNKQALANNLPNVFKPVQQWGNTNTVNLIEELKNSGIENAWIGLPDWRQAYAKPELVETAVSYDYLIGPYDSYHSIHEPGKEQWITAKFDDASLYENATITDKEGEKISGFKNVGRKLNPILSIDVVRKRVESILSTNIPFNSWFIDCDATGEIFDDYSKEHITTKQQDLNSRLERMSYIRDTKNMVIGSEGGHDFAASTIAFGHGIELPTFSWQDDDMSKNKDSEYYIGKYYNKNGGVPEHFSKQIPIKENFYNIFLNPIYKVPLFKLVYNNSVITTYHWDWSTFKIENEVENRMLFEILYNIPPLYHLDNEEFEKYKNNIISHTKMWSEFNRKAINEEMTNFIYLTEDKLIQQANYGKDLLVVANFSENSYSYEKYNIPSNSLLIYDGKNNFIYTPSV